MLLTCILGLTWLFGVFYINHESLFMAYFFTIFNTLQVSRKSVSIDICLHRLLCYRDRRSAHVASLKKQKRLLRWGLKVQNENFPMVR